MNSTRPFVHLGMKHFLTGFLFLLLISNFNRLYAQKDALYKMVNPFIGTGGHGHTFPGAVMPFGACQLSPDTRLEGWDGCGGYHDSDSVIYGFSHTHLSGTGCSDYGDVLLMPVVQAISLDQYQYASRFSHITEKAHAGYYEVFLNDPKIKVELTATLHGGVHRYSFEEQSPKYVVLDLKHRDEVLDSEMEQIDDYTLRGYRFSKAWAKNQKLFFEIKFSHPIESIQYDAKGPKSSQTGNIQLKKSLHCIIHFQDISSKSTSLKNSQLMIKTAISGVDAKGAQNNLEVEMPETQWSFEYYQHAAEQAWEKELAKIAINPADNIKVPDANHQILFYTALYHCMIHPSLYSDADGRYRGRDDQIHSTEGKFDYYTVFSLWDTYRALHPLLTLIDKKRTNDFIQTFIRQYQEGGRLPIWELSANETNCMIGYHVVSVIWDAYNKGIREFDAEIAYEAMTRIATHFSHYEGEGLQMHLKEEYKSGAADAEALESYCKYGYVRADDSHESVSKTLEYAYNDWCIAQMAKALRKTEDYDYYMDRSRNWMNVYDPTTGFMRARKNGCLYQPFSPYMVDNNYTEANSWQYSFYMPHDVLAYLELLGSQKKMEEKLDDLFQAQTKTEGREQSDITGLIGQYAHGNEPSHHIAYLYNYIGKNEKTEKLVQRICDSFYTNKPDGLIGNEDCGQMSAWYVFAQLGFYPSCPGENNYDARDIEPPYAIQDGFVSNTKEVKVFNTQFEEQYAAKRLLLLPADVIGLRFPHRPGKVKKHSTVPFLMHTHGVFEDSVRIEFASAVPGLPISYSLNQGAFTNYVEPFYLKENSDLRFYALRNTESFKMQQAQFTKLPKGRKVYTLNKPHASYTAGGPEGLVNGLKGKLNWRAGDWQGYQGQDIELVVRLENDKKIKAIETTFLEDQNSWIFYPTEVEYWVSQDSVNWKKVNTQATHKSDHNLEISISNFGVDLLAVNDENLQKNSWRFIRLKAKHYGKMPQWHEGRGYDTYIFLDEIRIIEE
jgi:predicted alpha-1,2-mannosidase